VTVYSTIDRYASDKDTENAQLVRNIPQCRQQTGNQMLMRVWKDEIFRTRPDPPWGPPNLLHNGYRVFPGDKAAGAWR